MKKVQVLIISLVTILVLGIVTFVILYFATDILKSDKEMFYKYVSEMNIKDAFYSNSETNYQNRKESEPYTNKGTIKITGQVNEESNINEEIEFDSKVDLSKKLASSQIDIKKESETLVTINYFRNEDFYGLELKDLIIQYIVFENDNLKDLAKKFGIENVDNIPDKIDLSEINQTLSQQNTNSETVKVIFDKYLDIVIENIPEDKYSKIEDGYSLTIDLKTLQNVWADIEEAMKEDKQIYELITNMSDETEQLSFEEYQEWIEETMPQMISEETDEKFNVINIEVYKQGKIYIKLNTDPEKTGTYTDVTIEKNTDEVSLKLNSINYENTEFNFSLTRNLNVTENETCNIQISLKNEEELLSSNITMTRNGKLDSNRIQNNITASIEIPEVDLKIDLEYNNNETFESNVDVEEFDESNYLIINELSEEQINNLSAIIVEVISEKGDLNAIDVIETVGIGLMSTSSSLNLKTTAISGVALVALNTTIVLKGEIVTQAKQATQTTQEELGGQAKEMFNSQLSMYEGVQNGSNVMSLIQRISIINKSTPDHIVSYNNISAVQDKMYEISFEKDENGYINNVIITEQQ